MLACEPIHDGLSAGLRLVQTLKDMSYCELRHAYPATLLLTRHGRSCALCEIWLSSVNMHEHDASELWVDARLRHMRCE